MTVFIDTNEEEYIALAEITFSRKVNGEKSLKGTIYTGDEVINAIDRGWKLKFQDEVYYITYALPVDDGDTVSVEFDAIHEFFYKMGKSAVYKQLDGSNTAATYLDLIFSNSGYNYSLATTIPAFEKQSFGMKNRLALFNDFINSTETEFSINGKTVTIVEKIGSDLSTIVRKGFNMQELGLEHNISDFVTYIKGFGAFKNPDNESQGRLEVEYKSPLADIYGILEADPVVDERYTQESSLTAHLKEIVESSYSISVSLSIEDLQLAGYEYGFPDPGDYIMAINEDLNFQQKIRIVGIEETYDVLGNELDKSVTCNSLNAVDQKNQADASNSKTWNDISNGVKPIPNDWLTSATQTATTALLNAQTELKFTTNGILAIDKNDSNRIVILNSAGLGVSTNGGKTFGNAITAEGVNASAITTGILKAINIEGVTISGSTFETTSGAFKTILKGGNMTTSYNRKKFLVIDGTSFELYQSNGTSLLGQLMRVQDKETKKESMTFAAERGQYISLASKGTDGIYNRQIQIDGSTGEVSMNNLTMNGVIKDGGLSNFYASKKFWVSNNVELDFYSNLNMNGFTIQNQSDIRLKENIVPTQIDGIEETKKISFYEFDRRQNYKSKDPTIQPNKERELGVIAQYTPFLATKTNKDNYLSINLNKQLMLNTLTNKQIIERLEKLEKQLQKSKSNRRKYHGGGIK
ncbi:phage tail spike protein [Enterococcus faecium]|uniref:phage tail spike protein n=1 Tax=Enterococcus faecium TaxID=1352 RepID=UPI000BF0D84D|nr:phage tail spike protein [Enterococcus faecium]PEH49297.1 hypothetical protein CRM75_16090 [Enterococcus faecium]